MAKKEKEVETEPVTQADLIEDTTKGLSLRDALEVAVEGTKEEPSEETKKEVAPEEPAKEPEAPATTGKSGGNRGNDKPLDPPAEWDREDKELFSQSSPEQQRAALKLHAKRQSKLEEIKREAAELQWAKDIAREVEPFLKTNKRGESGNVPKEIIKALKAVNELDTGDPLVNAAAYLRAKGKEVPKELLSAIESGGKSVIYDEKIIPLQTELNSIKARLAQEDQVRAAQPFAQAWTTFEQEKNAAGVPKFPDVNTTESGIKLSSSIGSLVTGKHPDSVAFLGYIKARIPDASHQKVIEEGYRWLGGRVDESEPTRTQDNTQSHIIKSIRAAASKPGRGANVASTSTGKKFKTYREAAEAALAELNSD
jgi:hypothetical protein